MGEEQISRYLTHLAVERNVAASTQNQALSALLFLYQQVLARKLDFLDQIERVKRPPKIPVVFTPAEAHAVLDQLDGVYQLMAELLYGSGLRLLECLRLRVKDIDFGYSQLTIRDGKGMRERITVLPERVRSPLRLHLQNVRQMHDRDLARGSGRVYLPFALNRKYPPASALGFGNTFSRQRKFRSTRVRINCAAITSQKKACKTPLKRPLGARVLPKRQAAIHFVIVSRPICSKTVTISAPCKNSLGHRDVSTTMIYTHVLNKPGLGVRSPWMQLRTPKKRCPSSELDERLSYNSR